MPCIDDNYLRRTVNSVPDRLKARIKSKGSNFEHANRNHSITTTERTSPRFFITSTPPFFALILDLFLLNCLVLS
uniref:Uncharacterized protein n=1 Tax=Caenorhabditis japonica TaxID=281687 RepID=A0A8R1EEH1_CAEJA